MFNQSILELIITFLTIFAVVVLAMFLLAKSIERFLIFKQQIKPEALALTVSFVGIMASTTVAFVCLYLIVSFILNFANTIGEKITSQSQLPPLERSDCKVLVDFVSRTQNEISLLENHRNIEETSNLFTISLEYQKGVDIMRQKAKEYSNLKVKSDTEVYAEKIAELLNKKADYFAERIKVDLSVDGVDGVFNLLDKMDEITEDRTEVINQINEQCSSDISFNF